MFNNDFNGEISVSICPVPVASIIGSIISNIPTVTINIAKAPNQKYPLLIFFLSISQSIKARINEPNNEHAKPIPKDDAFPYSLSTKQSPPTDC